MPFLVFCNWNGMIQIVFVLSLPCKCGRKYVGVNLVRPRLIGFWPKNSIYLKMTVQTCDSNLDLICSSFTWCLKKLPTWSCPLYIYIFRILKFPCDTKIMDAANYIVKDKCTFQMKFFILEVFFFNVCTKIFIKFEPY